MTLSILLVVGSLALMILEVFLVSFGALAIAAVTMGVGGLVAAFGVSATFGWIMSGVLLVGIPSVVWGAFKLLGKLPWTRGFYLEPVELTDAERHAGARMEPDLLGREGRAISALRPAGSAEIDGEPVQVVTTGKLVGSGARVRVVDTSGNRIVVEEIS